ncbi:MAG: hypothetical protein QOG04_96 [Actinomycetota bacterium]|jgi:hypothetical protein|nr:hypothetical protein [Actinomycetota bacterium]
MQHARENPTPEREDQRDEDSEEVQAYLRNIYKRKRRFSSRTVVIVSVLAIMVALFAADALYTIRGLRSSLQKMSTSMREGQAAIVDGDLVRAEQAFIDAGTQADEAHRFAARPSLLLGTWLPIVGNDAQILSQLPDVGQAIVEGGTTAIDAARALGATSKARLAKNIYRNGRVDFRSIDDSLDYLNKAGTSFKEADKILAALPPANIAPVGEALKTANLQVDAVLDVIDRADTLLKVLPDMMGRQGPRRYLVAFQSPSEARATGGFIGLYGILETSGGRAKLVHVGLWDLIEQRAEQGGGGLPNRLQALLDALGSDEVHQINLSPSFESVSERFLRVYERATGDSLSGVLAVDPTALGYLTEATGPLKGAGIEEEVTPANAVPLILRDSYIRFGNDPQTHTRFLETLIKDFYGKLGSGAVDAPKLADAFGRGGRSKHLKIYSTIPDEQTALREFGMDGSVISAGPDVQFIFHNNLARNKIDYFLHREFDTTIDITRDNYAEVSTKILLENRAPKQMAEGLGWQGDNRGINEMALGVLLPEGAVFEQMTIRGKNVRPVFSSIESTPDRFTSAATPSFPVVSHRLVIGPKQEATVRVTYRVPDATNLLRGGDFGLNLFPQATVRPDHYVVTIRPPVGFHVLPKVPGSTPTSGGAIRFEGDLDQQVWLWTEVLPL